MKIRSYIHASRGEPLGITFDGYVALIAYCGREKTGVIKFATVVEFAVEYCQRVRMLYEVCGYVPRDRRREMAERSGRAGQFASKVAKMDICVEFLKNRCEIFNKLFTS